MNFNCLKIRFANAYMIIYVGRKVIERCAGHKCLGAFEMVLLSFVFGWHANVAFCLEGKLTEGHESRCISGSGVCMDECAPNHIWGTSFQIFQDWTTSTIDLNKTATATLFSKAFLKKCEVSCRPQMNFPVQLPLCLDAGPVLVFLELKLL